ncbi:hypothetical protein AMS62_03365 [Bacillus sp. FJAT-18019]|nr:hypothetical protein AMS62_03365 [Bacillus sp. FJAT-18019]
MSNTLDWNNFDDTGFYLLEKMQLNESDPYQLHFSYNKFIKLFDKHRQTDPENEKRLMQICKLDIELFPKFREAWFTQNPTYNFLPRVPSFQKLIQIYERNLQIEEAVDICKLAIHYNLDDGTKGGYAGRLQKLEKKLSRSKRTPQTVGK